MTYFDPKFDRLLVPVLVIVGIVGYDTDIFMFIFENNGNGKLSEI